MGKLINRIPGSRLLISSLPGNALRTLVDIARLAERFKMRSQISIEHCKETGKILFRHNICMQLPHKKDTKLISVLFQLHTGKCIRRFAGIYAYWWYSIDRTW